MLKPNLNADLKPGVGAAGFCLGDSYVEIINAVGVVQWIEPGANLRNIISANKVWVGVKKRIGRSDEVIITLTYMDDVVFLAFGKNMILYQIVVGEGYIGAFNGIRIGDDLRALENNFEIDFNDADDEFLILKGTDYICGISFDTSYRSSLINAPLQQIRHISIHDWDLA